MIGADSEYFDTSGINNGSAPDIAQEEKVENEGSNANNEKNNKILVNKKFNPAKSNIKPGTKENKITTRQMTLGQDEFSRRNTGNSAALAKQVLDQTYITQDENDPEVNGVADAFKQRLDSKASQSRDKTSGGKRVPPGVRLYNQAKNNPKGKIVLKKKEEQPIKPVLTKDVEDMLIQSNREKWEEVVKTSNTIHDILSQAGIDNQSIVDALFADPLFRHVLANLLFNSKNIRKEQIRIILRR